MAAVIGVPKPIHITRPRVGIKRKPKPAEMRVSPQVAEEVFARDLRISGGCVAPKIDPLAGECRDMWGNFVLPSARAAWTIGHVREFSGGERRSVPRWLVTTCWGHGVQSWELRNTQRLRDYLEKVSR